MAGQVHREIDLRKAIELRRDINSVAYTGGPLGTYGTAHVADITIVTSRDPTLFSSVPHGAAASNHPSAPPLPSA